ncbi:hypothetical protein BDV41DRAFT_560927 [Aspergillus transmontanensis]|uniref:NmrA-like domain-containing protein n=1 Tax=Aspergillus transmontanensis TaxID=1034304 RepID=A0A5N6WBE8_9EURO|nr:hypothetical protein BDV41DRAFT_560927 [Aspergillus transmontanensis]
MADDPITYSEIDFFPVDIIVEPKSKGDIFIGVDVLMLISYASVEAHKKAITAAHRSGVSHIFYSTLAFEGNCEKTSEYMATELSNSMTYTAIREGLRSDLFSVYLAMFDPRHPVEEITIPHSGSGPGIAWAKRDELGKATAKTIVLYIEKPEIFRLMNQVLLLSRSEVLCLKEIVQVLRRVIGKHRMIREDSADEYASLPQVRDTFTYLGAAVVSPLLGEILRREPVRFETTERGMLDS